MTIEASVVMASWNNGKVLDKVLKSILIQKPPFEYEVIVVDHGSTDDTPDICRRYPIHYKRIERTMEGYTNPCVPRNVGFRLAKGRVIVSQSADVSHQTPDAIEKLVTRLTPNTCTIARVRGVSADETIINRDYYGLQPRRLIFLLGALYRSDVYAVGGQDEDFTEPCFEDRWFRECLMHTLNKTANFCWDVIAYHYNHPIPPQSINSRHLYFHKVREAKAGRHPWTSRSGPWKYEEL